MAEPCRSLESLQSAWLDGELTAADASAVSAHLRDCARCRTSFESLRVTRSLLRSAPPRRAPALLAARSPGSRRGPLVVSRLAAAAAVVLAVLTGAAYSLGDGPPPDQPVVRVPMELYLADHVLRSTESLVVTPVLVEERP